MRIRITSFAKEIFSFDYYIQLPSKPIHHQQNQDCTQDKNSPVAKYVASGIFSNNKAKVLKANSK
jgi:hypothetical protein